MFLLLACGSGNTPPRFHTVNEIEIRNLFGLHFLETPLTVNVGERLDIEIEVDDPQKDRFRLLWPLAPPGWVWPEDSTSGHWTPPEGWWERSNDLSVVAIDKHGASDVLYLSIEVPDAEDEDTGFGELAYLFGAVEPETFEGYLGIYSFRSGLECQWIWPTTHLVRIPEDCPDCALAWEFTARDGMLYEGDCSEEPLALEWLPPRRIGHVEPNTVLLDVDGEWLPLGEGSIEDGLFNFGVLLP